jgi:hypothetical protein
MEWSFSNFETDIAWS